MTLVSGPTKTFFQQFGSLLNFVMGCASFVTLIVGGSVLWANTQNAIVANKQRLDQVETDAQRRSDRIDRLVSDLAQMDRTQLAFGGRIANAEARLNDATAAAQRADEKLSTLLNDVAIIKDRVMGTAPPLLRNGRESP